MEGSIGLRIGFIALLAVASTYVLLPSWLTSDAVDTAGMSASAKGEPPLEAWFVADDGEADASNASAVEARLMAAGLGPRRVEVDGERLVVHLITGQRKEAIQLALAPQPQVATWPADAVGVSAAAFASAENPTDLVDGFVGRGVLEGSGAPLDLGSVTAQAGEGGAVTVSFERLPDPVGPVVFAIGERPSAWTLPSVDGPSLVRFIGDPAAMRAALLATPLPEALTRWTPAALEAVTQAELAPPAWYEAWLPNTRIALGLDLQGGIDLTLQVDQEAAVISAVQRDRRMLLDRAAEEDRTVQIQRDRSRFAMEIASEAPFAEVRDWVDGQLRGEYVYVETVERNGVTWNVWEMSDQRAAEISEQAVEQNLETLRKRIDATGVKEPSIVKMGGGRINIQLPGVTDTRQATEAIGTQATLEFRMVDEDADANAVARAVQDAERALPGDQLEDVELLNEWLRRQGRLPDGRIVMWEYEETSPGKLERSVPLQLREEVLLTGGDVENASVGFDQNNIPRVLMAFKPRGAQIFCDVTKANVNKRFAILLDGEIRSAPNIREAICGGSASIEMGNSANAIDDANTLALVLRSGALTAPVDIGEVREIGSSLGADAIQSGTIAALIGGTMVGLFMVVWYRVPGIIADVALLLNVLLVFAFLALFGATLTLPGVAGIALTVGMAVDANIIIYERIREELRLGVTARQAVDVGFDKALSAILDANITTAFAGIVLYSYGTGPIKGFAVTLLVGIVTTLVTALYVTRTFMDLLTRSPAARLRL